MSTISEQVRMTSRLTVGIADVKLSGPPGAVIITYALGSCLGISIYDPVAHVGGILHAMLPSARGDTERVRENPARFVDSGVPQLFKAAYRLGAQRERIIVRVAGGAHMTSTDRPDTFQIGKRNFVALKKLLWRNGVTLSDCDVGGSVSRTMSLDTATGEVLVKTGQEEFTLSRTFPRDGAKRELEHDAV